jgi:hypothetical protein
MVSGGGGGAIESFTIYSIQRSYIIKPVFYPDKLIFTCDERIDIPTIEPLTYVDPVVYQGHLRHVVPCIEIKGADFDLDGINLTFETNEGVTVLPVKIASGTHNPLENPYLDNRYVLVLPRGTTGIKTCKTTVPENDEEVHNNFTFGIMPPPYNYDNALFGYLSYRAAYNSDRIDLLKLTTTTPTFASKSLPKGAGKQTINIENGVLFYNTSFSYPLSPESTTHNPKITLHGAGRDQVYTLSLNKTINTVSIDLFTGMITVYAGVTGEIMQQFKLALPYKGFETLSFEDFDDIDDSVLRVSAKGARVE